MSQREMLDLADRCIKSHVITEFPSVYSAPDVKECKSAAGSGVHLCSKFPPSQLLFSTSMYIEPNFQKQEIDHGSLYWCEYTCFFICLENTCLSWIIVYLWGHIWVCSTRQYWKEPCSSFKHNLFSASFLELELSFQISVCKYRIGFSSLLRPPEHCRNNNHNHSNTKQKACNHEELQSNVSSVTWGGLCWTSCVPFRKGSSSLAL